ncbi:MAG: SMP-30/gluconolactonase/LRE family protein [Halioglobus sp.]|nr:SMP-30/gluconolactonase/LRE family protein [Halioglobus sp.]
MRALAALLLAVLLVLVLAAVMPAPIDPVAWTPDPDPGLTGPYTPNDRLAAVQRLIEGVGTGPEDVACGPDSTYYTGFADGRIVRFRASGEYDEIANTGGRPLGMQLDAAGRLIVADGVRGLLAVTDDGNVDVLADTVNGQKIVFADDLDIAEDGTIWFSDAASRHGYKHSMYNFFEGRPSGSLLSYDPANGATRVHLTDLFFANGVALGPRDEYVLVNETHTGRITRLWLKGEKAGQRDLFKSQLPGTPDNLSFNGRDTFWVANPGLRAGVDALADQPVVRKILSRLPYATLSNMGPRFSLVIALDLDGEVREILHDPDAGFASITSVNECDGELLLGSLHETAVARLPH